SRTRRSPPRAGSPIIRRDARVRGPVLRHRAARHDRGGGPGAAARGAGRRGADPLRARTPRVVAAAGGRRRAPPAGGSRGGPAIAVDVPGFGASDRPWPYDYTVTGEARGLLAFLDARGIDRAILVGNSLGGGASLLAAAEHPERVAALVLVAPATPEGPIVWPVRLLRIPGLGELALALSNRALAAHGLRRWQFARPERVSEQAVDDAWRPMRVPGTRRAA